MVHFRTEVDVEPDYLFTEFYLEVELVWGNLVAYSMTDIDNMIS